MAVYDARPDASVRGAVLVVQEAFGVNAYIESVCRRLSREGYRALAPALFHRAGGGTAPYDDFSKVMPLFAGVDDDSTLMDLDAVLEELRADGVRDASIGVVGFCFGGRASFLAAARRRLGAAVGFYGGGIVSERLGRPALVGETAALATPWLGLFGDCDEGIPTADVESLRAALTSAPVATDIVRYPDAEHGFHCDVRASYCEAAALDGWSRALAWFDRHLEPF